MAIQQNFPDEGPTLNLNFAGSRTLDPRITFTRTSSATYMGSDGLIKIAPANSPRFDHSYNPATGEIQSLGLLVEESRINFIPYSETIGVTGWSGFRISATGNSVLSPSNTLTASLIEATESNVNGSATLSVFTPSITTYTFSVYAKANTGSFLLLRPQSNSTFTEAAQAWFDLSNGVATLVTSDGVVFTNSSQNIVPVGNGWFRCSVTFTLTNSSFPGNARIYIVDSNGSLNVTSGTSIYVWGAQLEVGSFSTSYIPTSGSTATRTPDFASITGTNFSSWYNQNEGTFFVSSRVDRVVTPGRRLFEASDGTGQNRLEVGYYQSGTYIFSTYLNSTQYQTYPIINSFPFITKQITSYNSSQLNYLSTADNIINTFNSFQKPNYTILTIGRSTGAEQFNGTISQLTYYPTRLPSSQLVSLTR